MLYLFIITHDAQFRPTASLVANIHEWVEDMTQGGRRIDGEPLKPPAEGRTLRIRGGKLQVSEGPAFSAVEHMCAYELVACRHMDEAIELAATHPMASVGSIEVRPVWADMELKRVP